MSYDYPDDNDRRKRRAAEREAQKVLFAYPSVKGWMGLGTKEELVIHGCFDLYRTAHLASDPKSGEQNGGVRYPGGRSIDLDLATPHFEAARITVPTLIVRGDGDTYATHADNLRLFAALGSPDKEFVEIPDAGHFIQFERTNLRLYQAIQAFLDTKK